jgi:hypothetical protein
MDATQKRFWSGAPAEIDGKKLVETPCNGFPLLKRLLRSGPARFPSSKAFFASSPDASPQKKRFFLNPRALSGKKSVLEGRCRPLPGQKSFYSRPAGGYGSFKALRLRSLIQRSVFKRQILAWKNALQADPRRSRRYLVGDDVRRLILTPRSFGDENKVRVSSRMNNSLAGSRTN